jgi:hypothetical protein
VLIVSPSTLRQLNTELRKRGVDRQLFRDRSGYYYFEAPEWPACSVYVNHFSVLSVERWVAEFESLKADAQRAGWVS